MKFEMTVDMDNAAFEDAPASELGRIVRLAVEQILDGSSGENCRDANGNSCGSWTVEK